MSDQSSPPPSEPAEPDEFARAAHARSRGFLREFWRFARSNKRWWMTPILVILVVLGALVLLGGSGGGPFIYSLF